MAGGEWWRLDRPWKVLSGARGADGAAGGTAGGARGAEGGAAEDGGYRQGGPELPEAGRQAESVQPFAWSGSARTPLGDFPGWDSVQVDFSVADPVSFPDQRRPPPPAAELVPPPAPGPVPAPRSGALTGALTGTLTGRRPSALLLLAGGLLLAGAVSGLIPVMLVGWGAGYLSRRLGEFTKKFAVLGIPMATMTGWTLWLWGREQGRWGTPVAPGAGIGHIAWNAAPDVLRLAAVLSGLFLLALTLRRRGNG